MNLSVLLELALKSDEVIELLEIFDLSVVYAFDRLHENTDDQYWVSAHQAGFELRFNARQVLDTIFLFVLPSGEFSAVDPSVAGVPFYASFGAARAAFVEKGIQSREGVQQGWVKGDFGDYTVHYEFNVGGALALVTLAVPPNA